jgi:hypothetical protein
MAEKTPHFNAEDESGIKLLISTAAAFYLTIIWFAIWFRIRKTVLSQLKMKAMRISN